MTYEERLRRFEQEKRELQKQDLNDVEYMRAIKKLADKWRV
jgi:hypothetical protein